MSKKVKVSREEFAEVLLHWIVMHIGRKGMKQDAKSLDLMREGKELFGLNLSHREELSRLFEELVALNLWIVVAVTDSKFKDMQQRDDCLHILHRRFFDQFLRETTDDFEQWLSYLTVKYGEYREAMKTCTGKDLMTLGHLIQRNLHGERYPSDILNLQIMLYVGENGKALGKALNQYEIE
jgi:hypothetical protein